MFWCNSWINWLQRTNWMWMLWLVWTFWCQTETPVQINSLLLLSPRFPPLSLALVTPSVKVGVHRIQPTTPVPTHHRILVQSQWMATLPLNITFFPHSTHEKWLRRLSWRGANSVDMKNQKTNWNQPHIHSHPKTATWRAVSKLSLNRYNSELRIQLCKV